MRGLSVLEPTIFSPRIKPVSAPNYIKAMHPKTEILPERDAIARVLRSGWIGQQKIHGHRAQIHVPAKGNKLFVYNRQGQPHRKNLEGDLAKEILTIFRPEKDWNVIDTEWIKPEDKIYYFDILKKDGKLLRHLNFEQRWKLLPHGYISSHLVPLPVYKTVEKCIEILDRKDPHSEGLVFKSPSPGFLDTSIVRCRRQA